MKAWLRPLASGISKSSRGCSQPATAKVEKAEARAEKAKVKAEEAEAKAKEAEAKARTVEGRLQQEREQHRQTSLEEFIQHCHNSLSRPLRPGNIGDSTKGTIPAATSKHCPLRLRPWTDCNAIQQEVYNSVRRYLQPDGRDAPQLFLSISHIESFAQRLSRLIRRERSIEYHERLAVEDHVGMIISELCRIPHARAEFGLGDGVQFESLSNTLDEPDDAETRARCYPNQSCVYRIDGDTERPITILEYQLPYKLSSENLRSGLQSIDFYREIVQSNDIPGAKEEKLISNAIRLRLGKRATVDIEMNARGFEKPRTEIQRVLCLCLMSCRSRIPSGELQQHPPDSEYTGSKAAEDTVFECLPLSSPAPTTPGPVAPTPSQSGRVPSESHNFESEDTTDPDFMLGRKRGFGQVTASPTAENRASPP
ncbi:hypothetical protein LOZ66_002371 [Ophidiomyces ophidiicola]|nr:hypothetical protein LOZ66_002371 [Ophidiomyces ophidiicola]